MAQFEINVGGRAEIPHSAERAVIMVNVSSSGTNKAAVSDEVLTTAKHLESLLRDLSPQDDTPEAKETAALAHWSKKSLSATSHVPYDKDGETRPRRYNASINFDIRFKLFKALGDFGAKLSTLEHVEVNDIDWRLTVPTQKSYRSQLRKEAARDALQKATEYCEVMGCTNFRAVELQEGQSMTHAASSNRSYQTQMTNPNYPNRQSMLMAGISAPGFGSSNPHGLMSGSKRDERDESPLEFRPEEVRMSMDVTVKFHAE